MARSKCIYVVQYDEDLIATFTVKHELTTWLDNCIHPDKDYFTIYRMKDNDRSETFRSEPIILTKEELRK